MNKIESLEPRRLFTAGGLDAYFGDSGTAATDFGKGSSAITDISLLSDGRIVAGGWHRTKGATAPFQFALARYTVDGEPDASFSIDGKTTVDFGGDAAISAIAVDSQGRTIAAGVRNSSGAYAIGRFGADGSLDDDFAEDGKLFAFTGAQGIQLSRVFALDDGKILLVGNDNSGHALIGRYRADGTSDKTFSSGGFISQRITRSPAAFNISAAAIDESGKIVLCGTVEERINNSDEHTSFGFVARLNPNGTLDSSFGGDGIVALKVDPGSERAVDLFIAPDGIINVLVRGGEKINIARFDFNGEKTEDISNTVDPGGLDSFRFARQSDNDILVSDGISKLARIDPAGTLDQTFGTAGVSTTGIGATDLALNVDGSIIIAGSSSDDFAIQRLWRSDAPAATFEGRNRTKAGETGYRFQVTYRDDVGLDFSSIDNSDIELIDPHGAHIRAYLESKGVTPGEQVLATYKIKPIGGRWDQTDNGKYTIRILSNRVKDTHGNFILGRMLGSFRVSIT